MRPKLSFRHMGIFSSALLFDRRARQMISDVEAAVRDVHPMNGRWRWGREEGKGEERKGKERRGGNSRRKKIRIWTTGSVSRS
jgi:hypothetical protein